jgi:Mn2+/Fe2+ NRAMP family transporter
METLLKLQGQNKEISSKLSQTETALSYSIAVNILLAMLLLSASLMQIRATKQNKNQKEKSSQETATQPPSKGADK